MSEPSLSLGRLFLFACALVASGLWAPSAHAFEANVGKVPNPVYAMSGNQSLGCITCHNNPAGGTGCSPDNDPLGKCWNPFGRDFFNNGQVWNQTLANMDSDGDGYTNGEELQDFAGTWTIGLPYPGVGTYATRPGFSNSHPGGTDADGDGYCWVGRDLNMNGVCTDPGEHTDAIDCNDSNAGVHSDATEICTNAGDDDCNGLATLEDPVCADVVDGDGDGYCPSGRDLNGNGHCLDSGEPGSVVDCDDESITVFPGAPENCFDGLDNDCDGDTDLDDSQCTGESDEDGDGYCPIGRDLNGDGDCLDEDVEGEDETAQPSDCDDDNEVVNPGIAEICSDTFDNDCDGLANLDDPDCAVVLDGDGDGQCPQGTDLNGDGDCIDPGEDTDDVDCDDLDATIYTGAREICSDPIDQDCDGFGALDDEDCFIYLDMDGDGFCPSGVDKNGDGDCIDGAFEPVLAATDCDDTDPLVNPLATEACFDGIDNDCNRAADEEDPLCAAYVDFDLDGYCQPGLDMNGDGDCTDENEQTGDVDLSPHDPTSFPGAPEHCLDGIDNDQDGFVDADDDQCTYDTDADGDGFCPLGRDDNGDGDCLDTGEDIEASDCNDSNPDYFPGADELCLVNADSDCDGDVYLDDADCIDRLADRDGDGFCGEGVDDDGDGFCIGQSEDRYGHDCDDRDAQVSPRAHEHCTDAIDNDCDGNIDGADTNCQCSADSECADISACTIGACYQGVCRYKPNAACESDDCSVAAPGAGGDGGGMGYLIALGLGAFIVAGRRATRRKRAVLLGGLFVAMSALPGTAHAWGGYEANVPNGAALVSTLGGFPSNYWDCGATAPSPVSANGCRLCHYTWRGGYAATTNCNDCPGGATNTTKCHNPFGDRLWRGNDGVTGSADDIDWSENIAEYDSDGDGWTNGQELGDPFFTWSTGETPPYTTSITLPGWTSALFYWNGASWVSQGTGEPGYSPCARDDCDTGASCTAPVSGTGEWNCTCTAGWMGYGETLLDGDVQIDNWIETAGNVRRYELQAENGCTDCNECVGQCGGHLCGPGTCTNVTNGNGWSCVCPAGYQENSGVANGSGQTGEQCVEIDECAEGTDLCCDTAVANGTCEAVASCSNTTGSYSCACPLGFTGNGRSNSTGCQNVDECAAGETCGGHGTCVDRSTTVPGWDCTCDLGYSAATNGIGETCVVADECTSGSDDCHFAAVCADPDPSPGSTDDYTCTCPAGWTQNGSGRGASGCLDVNECNDASNAANCGPGVTGCVNSAGSYSCSCAAGFVDVADDGSGAGDGVGEVCINVDECMLGTHDCGPHGSCTDEVPDPSNYTAFPAWSCTCDPSYVVDQSSGSPHGQTCRDGDECAGEDGGNNCSDDATCTNLEPEFDCDCNAGYSGDGVTCTEIDECEGGGGGHDCSIDATCTNTPGSFTCACLPGFTGDGEVCENIDECLDDGLCDMYATCNDLHGSFACVCNDGFLGTGFPDGCIDVNECAAPGACGPNEVCINRLGDGNLCQCAPGYTRLSPDEPCLRTCGDGHRAAGEECDDENVAPGDGCSATCEVESGWACSDFGSEPSACEQTCGDGILRIPGEECDDGAGNSDTEANACRTTCELAYCGDGIIDDGEECDDGADNSNLATGACRTSCKVAFCGDGVLDMGERCDFGGGVALAASVCVDECFTLPDAGVGSGGSTRSRGCATSAPGADGRGGAATVVMIAFGLLLSRMRRRR